MLISVFVRTVSIFMAMFQTLCVSMYILDLESNSYIILSGISVHTPFCTQDGSCMDEMGLGNGLLPDRALTASSVRMPSTLAYGPDNLVYRPDNPAYGPGMARLHSASGWRPAHDSMHEYLKVIHVKNAVKQFIFSLQKIILKFFLP
jgi:hypothetical protein